MNGRRNLHRSWRACRTTFWDRFSVHSAPHYIPGRRGGNLGPVSAGPVGGAQTSGHHLINHQAPRERGVSRWPLTPPVKEHLPSGEVANILLEPVQQLHKEDTHREVTPGPSTISEPAEVTNGIFPLVVSLSNHGGRLYG